MTVPGLALALLVATTSVVAGMSDEQFLDELQRRCFRFFWEQANPETGLIADRAGADGQKKFPVASIASVGFGLAGICIAEERGWIKRQEAYQRVLTTLRFLWEKMPNVRGFHFHFVDVNSGARVWNCELSSVDTALLMAGVLTARQYYKGTEVEELATKIYHRVDWPWMLAGGKTLSMGWTPEGGFLGARWDGYSEQMLLYLLGIGSPTHPLPPETWHAWRREPVITYAGRTYLQCPPLFTHQYSHAWIDFRHKRDAYADYWRNSVLATLAHRQFCIDLRDKFPKYAENLWGITASDGPNGYKAWGGPPATTQPPIDGTVVPCAAAGSIPFAPRETLAALRFMLEQYGDRIWKKYGFVDAFNPHTGWVATDVIGIDVGITLLMAENYRSGFVWKYFMQNPEIQRAMQLAGFRSTAPSLPAADKKYLRRLARDTWRCIDSLVEPATGLPYDNSRRGEFTSVSNIGLYLTDIVAARDLGFISHRAAERRIARTLDSLKKLKTWHGFQQCWNSVKTLEPATHDPGVSVLDSGNLAGGLITVGQAFPKFRQQCRQLLEAMDWGAFYDKDKKLLLGGFNTQTGKFNPQWHLSSLGADSRLASFLALASGKAPPESWEALDRSTEERHHARYLKPGWQGGGLFMQYINGLRLDERHTFMGQSAENFAYAQMTHAAANNYPVWGWSASESPDGEYLGWGKLRDSVVTPHASALAIDSFPFEVVTNLRALEKLGARSARFGFYDAIELGSGRLATNFLVLDQSMLFLSLANYLHNNCVRRRFQADPLVQRGRQLICDYRKPAFGTNVSVFVLRELPRDLRLAPQKSTVARRHDGWQNADWQLLDPATALETGVVTPQNEARARFAFAWDEQALYFTAQVQDRRLLSETEPSKLYEQDCVELYIDPQNDGLRWGNREDFQFGFAVPDKTWEWFGQRVGITATTRAMNGGYVVQAAIPWSLLGLKPARETVLQVSVAVHSVAEPGGAAMKLNWNWQPTANAVRLGRLRLD
jgi:hypothetical protein